VLEKCDYYNKRFVAWFEDFSIKNVDNFAKHSEKVVNKEYNSIIIDSKILSLPSN
jgi:hypothetical protein